ncbi:MAG: polysaccharide biosynthesis protein [Planctomycetes bacterium]|nr:polysaccharide biosynthesis protein [Planctomycetota bacterium]
MTRDPGFDLELDAATVEALLGRPDATPSAIEPPPGTILVTGAGGSLGALVVRRLAARGRRVVALDRAEAGLFRLGLALRSAGTSERVRLVVRDAGSPSIAPLVADEEVGVVLHAAAHKHVGLMEDEAEEAWRNNVEVTAALLESCRGVADFLLLSTDKAVAPVGVMGRTKAAAEALVLNDAADRRRRRVLRLPNVLGSAGSVVQVFRRALALGETLQVRGEDSERLFLGPEEALQALLTALAWPRSGLLAPIAPPAIAVLELARRAVRLWAAAGEAAIRIVPRAAGERRRETLLASDELPGPGPAGLVTITRRDDAGSPSV